MKTIGTHTSNLRFKEIKDPGRQRGTNGVSRFLFHDGHGDDLFVLIHGYASTATAMLPVAEIARTLGDPKILMPEYPASFISQVNPNSVVRDIVAKIDSIYTKDISKITIVGHSIGALLARKVYVCANWRSTDLKLEKELSEFSLPRSWAQKVDRIVLLAGMNRGWQISPHMSIKKLFAFKAGELLHTLMLPLELLSGTQSLIFSVRRGAPFITMLRLQWLEIKKDQTAKAITIQLLGTIDDLVSPEDNTDLITGSDFFYIDVPRTNHTSILELTETIVEETSADSSHQNPVRNVGPSKRDESTESIRAEKFRIALTKNKDDLQKERVILGDLAPLEPRPEVLNVVFIIHGIRDPGHWTQRVARKITARFKDQILTATETSTYGYFPMLPFILPGTRRRKVEWLMDQYSENKALYPKAEFHYVGHSNGTYLLAKALEDYPACRFNHVVFAGSVVRRSFPWTKLKENNQVKRVLNFVATGDWVVAFFPKLFQVLRLPPLVPYLQDLGSAGHDGFDTKDVDVIQRTFIYGDHGAAIHEDNWDTIAEFIVDGSLSQEKEIYLADLLRPRRNRLVVVLGSAPYIVWITIMALLIFVGFKLAPALTALEWFRVLALGGFLWIIRFVLTTV